MKDNSAVAFTIDSEAPDRTRKTPSLAPQTGAPENGVRKVLMLVTELEDYTIAFANGLARHVQVVLAVPRRQYARLAEWIDPAIDLRLMDWPRHRSPANLRLLVSLTRLVRQEKPDVIHLLSNNTLWLNLAAPFWKPVPLITTVHDISVHPGDADTGVMPGWSTSLIVRQSDRLVVHGQQLRHLAVQRFQMPPERVHVLSHPAILRYAEQARRDGLARRPLGTGLNILLFGRIFAYKGLENLIEAEALLKDRLADLRVVIAGRGDDPWAARARMGDPDRYDIRHRFIEDSEVSQLFLDADVIVLPYIEASQSGVLHLAAAFGKPTIVTDVGELRATVETHGLGLVVPPDDSAALADAIEMLAQQPDLRAAHGARALEWAAGAGAPATVGAVAVGIYNSALRKR